MLIFRIRRRLELWLIRAVKLIRISWYALLSANRFHVRPIRSQLMQAAGREVIACGGNVGIGVFPSLDISDSYADTEASNESAFVRVGDRTWINNGFRCIAEHSRVGVDKNCATVQILKSVSVGAGSVIANASVVLGNIPENVMAAGTPARAIRELTA